MNLQDLTSALHLQHIRKLSPSITRNRRSHANNQCSQCPLGVIFIPIYVLRRKIPQEINHQRTTELRRIRPFPLTPTICLERPREWSQSLPYGNLCDCVGDWYRGAVSVGGVNVGFALCGIRSFCDGGWLSVGGEVGSSDDSSTDCLERKHCHCKECYRVSMLE